MQTGIAIEVIPQHSSYPICMVVSTDTNNMRIQMAVEDARNLAEYLSGINVASCDIIWVGHNVSDYLCRVNWSSESLVIIGVFGSLSTDQGINFTINAYISDRLSKEITSALSRLITNSIVESIPTEVVVDPLVGAKKRMNDNLRWIFRQ